VYLKPIFFNGCCNGAIDEDTYAVVHKMLLFCPLEQWQSIVPRLISASEVTTIWRYTNVYIIIIIIVMSMFVCLSVCLSVQEDIFRTIPVIITKFSCMLPMAVAQSSSSGVVAIRYVLPVLWIAHHRRSLMSTIAWLGHGIVSYIA